MTINVARLAQEALAHQHAGRIDMALDMFSHVLSHDPQHPQANFSLGIAAYQAGEIGASIEHFKIAAAKAKRHPQIFQLLGLALLNSGDLKAAREALQKAVRLAPENADFLAQLGDIYRLQHRPVMARQYYQRALKLTPENGYGLIGLGQLEVSLGNVSEAVHWFERAVAAGQELPSALLHLAAAQTHDTAPPILSQIENLIMENAQPAKTDQANLHWAAGKIYYDLGDTPHAAEHYRAARHLHYTPFHHDAHEERLAFMKDVFTKEFFETRKDLAHTSSRPLFVFGMPRSGTTLIEQILARHEDVASGGEQTFFRTVQGEFGLMSKPDEALEKRITELGPREGKRLAVRYLKELEAVNKRSPRVTDKMPHNFEMLWLMALLFPNASFVHCVRSPADVCVSLLSHALSPAHNYCQTQESVGRYFQSYDTLMKHWQRVLPLPIYTMSYEALVYDQEAQSRKLLTYAGLSWQDECLEFYKGDAPVTTFSNLQVRRPIYRSSIGRWKRHKTLLTSLFEALGPLAPEELRHEDSLAAAHTASLARPANDPHHNSRTA